MKDIEYLETNLLEARKKYTFTRLRMDQISMLLADESLSANEKLMMIDQITKQMDIVMPSAYDNDVEQEYDIPLAASEIREFQEHYNTPVCLQIDQYLGSNKNKAM